MQRYFLQIAYKGDAFQGWQTQPNGKSVQDALETALAVLEKKPTPITGSGRTDAGVHAKAQIAHADLGPIANPAKYLSSLNALCPPNLAVSDVRPVRTKAHARYDAQKRTYQYFIHQGKNPFLQGFSTRINYPLDIDAMEKAQKFVLGRHDFTAFSKTGSDVNNYLCTIFECSLAQKEEKQFVFRICANRFMRGMVRALVGGFLAVGRGVATPEDVKNTLESKDRNRAYTLAPSDGLFLWEVEYPETLYI